MNSSYTPLIYSYCTFLLLTSLVSVPFITCTWEHNWMCTHINVVFIQKLEIQEPCAEKREEEDRFPTPTTTHPSHARPFSCATCCLHSHALGASPGINDHYGSIRAVTRWSLCSSEIPEMKMLVGSHQGRGRDWVRDKTLSHLAISDILTNSISSAVSQPLK